MDDLDEKNGIVYIVTKEGAREFRFYQKGGKRFVDVPVGTKVVPFNGGWQIQGPEGRSAPLDGKPVVLVQ